MAEVRCLLVSQRHISGASSVLKGANIEEMSFSFGHVFQHHGQLSRETQLKTFLKGPVDIQWKRYTSVGY